MIHNVLTAIGQEDCQVCVCSVGGSVRCLQVINMALCIIGVKCFTLHCTCHGFHFTFTPSELSQLHTSCVQSLSLTLRFIAELPGWNIPLYVRRPPYSAVLLPHCRNASDTMQNVITFHDQPFFCLLKDKLVR